MNVMLLAAGEGTRLRPYTEILPKPAIPFLTVPLAGHALSFLGEIEINKLVVNTFHLHAKIHELFASLPVKSKTVIFSDETGEILGSGGGLGKARKHFLGGGDFVMMNADEVILPKDSAVLTKAIEYHRKTNALATLMVMEHEAVGTQFGGVWADTTNTVKGFGKESFAGCKPWHFIGVQILSEKVFDFIPKSGCSNILYDALTAGIQNGELVQAFPFECTWFETGNPKDFFNASEKCFEILNNETDSFEKKALNRTLTTFASEKVRAKIIGNAHVLKAESAKVSDNVSLDGLVVLGPNSQIKGNSSLKNVIVNAGVSLPEDTHTSDKIILK